MEPRLTEMEERSVRAEVCYVWSTYWVNVAKRWDSKLYLTFSKVFSFQKSKGWIPKYSDLNPHFFTVFIWSFLSFFILKTWQVGAWRWGGGRREGWNLSFKIAFGQSSLPIISMPRVTFGQESFWNSLLNYSFPRCCKGLKVLSGLQRGPACVRCEPCIARSLRICTPDASACPAGPARANETLAHAPEAGSNYHDHFLTAAPTAAPALGLTRDPRCVICPKPAGAFGGVTIVCFCLAFGLWSTAHLAWSFKIPIIITSLVFEYQ